MNATLNSLGALIRSRPSTTNKIISVILNFNPLGAASPPLTPKQKVVLKSMERTTKALLVNVNKQYERSGSRLSATMLMDDAGTQRDRWRRAFSSTWNVSCKLGWRS